MTRLAATIACLAVLALAGCGEKSDADKAKATAVSFFEAIRGSDGKKTCRLLTETQRNKFEFNGEKCEEQLSGFEGSAIPKAPRAESVDIHGTEAIVRVSGKGDVQAEVTLEKEGGAWKVADF